MVTTSNLVTGVAAVVTHVDIRSATVTWEDMKADIFLNYNSKNQAFTDEAIISESMAWVFTKALTDSSTVTDTHSIHPAKAFADSVTPGDAIVVSQGFGRSYTDTAIALDTYVKESEDGGVLNTVTFNAEPLLSNPRTLPNVVVTLGKNSSDSVTATEEQTTLQAAGRSQSDATTSSDVLSSGFNKALADSVSPTDDFAIHETVNHGLVQSTIATDVATISFMSGFTLNGNTAIFNVNQIN